MITKLSTVFLTALLTGCTLLPTKELTTVAIYDLGPAPITAPQSVLSSPATIQLSAITAPTWLDTQAIHYRLAYHDPARVYTYAVSRWNAPPAELLTERFRQYFSGKNAHYPRDRIAANYSLKISLTEFTQIFNSPDSSQVVIQLHAYLYEPYTHAPIAQQSFLRKQDTQTADAAGAVAAFIVVSDNMLNELVQWLVSISQ